jgi:oligoribonuclease
MEHMVGASENDRLVWIDCEMTGLDLGIDELVEIAVVVTDFELRTLDPGFSVVIRPDESALANMNEFVTNMHRSSGLLDEIPHGVSLADAEFQVLEYIQRFVPLEGKAPLAGNTIGTDRMFLAKYARGYQRRANSLMEDTSTIR